MLEMRAFIAGAARDCASSLPRTLARLNRFRATFSETKFVIVTNDSSDDTLGVLRRWSASVPNAHILCLDGLASAAKLRAHRLALARNAYLSALRDDLRNGERYDLLLVVDMDGPNGGLIDDPEFTEAIRNAPADWAGLFANQRGPYYDVWALRHPTWSPDDCWQAVRAESQRWFGRRLVKRKAIEKHVHARQIEISPGSAPIAVDSAFGGFGVYRAEYLCDVEYSGLTQNGGEICEHVSLNSAIRRKGGNLYILPSLLNDMHP